MSKTKRLIFILWISLAVVAIGCFVAFPSTFNAENINHFIREYENHMLLVYLAISLFRGLVLIPSSPFVLAGALLFPSQPLLVLAISIIGVVAGSCFVFFFTEYLELEKVFEPKFAWQLRRLRKGMDKYGFWVVTVWAFFPAVPTDLISYTAAISRMPFWKFLPAIILGELPLVCIYVFTGQALGALFS